MSLLVIEDILPSRRQHQHFGLGAYPSELLMSPAERSLIRTLANLENHYIRPESCKFDGLEKKSQIGKDGWQVCLDVHHFAPNEISVKTAENFIIVEAKHEEREDEHGYISRQFCRRYQLPEGFKADEVVSTISSDGILTVRAPPIAPAVEGPKVRHVQIQQTGPARLSVNKNENENKSEGKTKAKK